MRPAASLILASCAVRMVGEKAATAGETRVTRVGRLDRVRFSRKYTISCRRYFSVGCPRKRIVGARKPKSWREFDAPQRANSDVRHDEKDSVQDAIGRICKKQVPVLLRAFIYVDHGNKHYHGLLLTVCMHRRPERSMACLIRSSGAHASFRFLRNTVHT